MLFTRTISAVLISLLVLTGVESYARKPKKQRRARHVASSVQSIEKSKSRTEAELKRLQREIASFQAQLVEHEKKERRSKQSLSAYNKKTLELKRMIAKLSAEAHAIESERREVDRSIVVTSSHLDSLKSAYAASARYLYTRGAIHSPSVDEYLLLPEQSLEKNRTAYYSHVAGQAHSKGRRKLDSVKSELNENKTELTETLIAQQSAISQKANEESQVEQRQQEESKNLAKLQVDRERLRRELEKRKASAKRLEGIIANLILREEKARASRKAENERRKRIAEKSGKSGAKRKHYEPIPDDAIDSRPAVGPHSLRWPTASHKIKQGFGEHRNAELNTVTMNLGIDIAAARGSQVTSAADGEVSLVSSLPSYGNIVVLRHAGGVHTVYANLDGVSVHSGSTIRAGQQVGTSGENPELGPMLHFEVWKGKSKQNPVGWLK